MISPLLTSVRLDFARVEIFEDFVIVTIDEGIVVNLPEREKLFHLFEHYFEGRPFAYISNRKNDYTVDPTSYLKKDEQLNLLGMAVICYSKDSERTANFEKSFYKRPFKVFDSFSNAKKWITSLEFSN